MAREVHPFRLAVDRELRQAGDDRIDEDFREAGKDEDEHRGRGGPEIDVVARRSKELVLGIGERAATFAAERVVEQAEDVEGEKPVLTTRPGRRAGRRCNSRRPTVSR